MSSTSCSSSSSSSAPSCSRSSLGIVVLMVEALPLTLLILALLVAALQLRSRERARGEQFVPFGEELFRFGENFLGGLLDEVLLERRDALLECLLAHASLPLARKPAAQRG